jgi:hypothetical protein
MYLATLFITKDGFNDDKIFFSPARGIPGSFEVVYCPGDLETTYRFIMDTEKSARYVHYLLKSLKNDTDPFEFLQVTTKIAPTVIYDIDDLSDTRLRSFIEDSIMLSLTSGVVRE